MISIIYFTARKKHTQKKTTVILVLTLQMPVENLTENSNSTDQIKYAKGKHFS